MESEFRIFLDGRKLSHCTDMSISRSKNAMTGTLNFGVAVGGPVDSAVLPTVQPGTDVVVAVGPHLAFTGTIDRRTDKMDKDGYSISFGARGKSKDLVDSGHRVPAAAITNTSTRSVVEQLIQPWRVSLDWQAADANIPRIRFRRGARVVDEIQRIAEEFGLHFFETRQGVLRVTDVPETTRGQPLVLGKNILAFNAEVSTDKERASVQVRGQRTDKEVWGEEAVLPTTVKRDNGGVLGNAIADVFMRGDATEEALERRAVYEMNKRTAASRKVNITVPGYVGMDGQPYDIGNLHYVEIPCAGLATTLELVEMSYTANTSKVEASLVLSPVASSQGASKKATQTSLSGITDSLSNVVDGVNVEAVGQLASVWDAPRAVIKATEAVSSGVMAVIDHIPELPPLVIPE
jgi:prophage tail gpP-like protein